MTPAELGEIEKRAADATPGPWNAEPEMRIEAGCRCLCCWERERGVWKVENVRDEAAQMDAQFIAHSRADIPALCAALREAWSKVDRLKLEIGRARIIERDLRVTRCTHERVSDACGYSMCLDCNWTDI